LTRSTIDHDWWIFDPLIEIGGFWVGFKSWKLCTLLVLQWWFCNKLGFRDFGGFAKLGGQIVVFGPMILWKTFPTSDKNPFKNYQVWTYKKIVVFVQWVSQSRQIELITFKVLLEQLWCKHHWRSWSWYRRCITFL
jgi:hypothetical protein